MSLLIKLAYFFISLPSSGDSKTSRAASSAFRAACQTLRDLEKQLGNLVLF